MRIRIQFLPDEFVSEKARRLPEEPEPPFLKGQLVFTYMQDGDAPAPKQPHERCNVVVSGCNLNFTPINEGGCLPRALSDDRAHENATTMVRSYYAAKCDKIMYMWTETSQVFG